MQWTCGALDRYPKNNKKFRYISPPTPHLTVWPQDYILELGIFKATPGVTWQWVMDNFGISRDVLWSVVKHSAPVAHLGWENAMSATHDDALRYMQRKPIQGSIPFWVRPFILEDLGKLSWGKVIGKWGIGNDTLDKIRKGRYGNEFLHLGN